MAPWAPLPGLSYQICTAPEPFDTLVTGLPLPACFSLPRFEFGAFFPSEPHLHFVLGQDDKLCLVPEEESQDSQEDVESMDKNEEEVIFKERDVANNVDVEITEL